MYQMQNEAIYTGIHPLGLDLQNAPSLYGKRPCKPTVLIWKYGQLTNTLNLGYLEDRTYPKLGAVVYVGKTRRYSKKLWYDHGSEGPAGVKIRLVTCNKGKKLTIPVLAKVE